MKNIFKKPHLKRPHAKAFLFALAFTILNHFVIYLPGIPSENIIKRATSNKKGNTDYYDAKDTLNHNFLIVDISNDAATVCDSSIHEKTGILTDDSVPAYSPCYPVADINKLAELFKWLAENHDKYGVIVCDMIFDRMEVQTKEDSMLLGYVLNIQNTHGDNSKIIFASIYDYKNEHFISSEFSNNLKPVNKGAVNEDDEGSIFFRYDATYNNGKVKSLPLLMFERIDHAVIGNEKLGFYRYHKNDNSCSIAHDLFIPEMHFSNKDIDSLVTPGNYAERTSTDSTINKMDLWQCLLRYNNTDNYYLEQALKGKKKNIFIGSFNHDHEDTHKTLYGDLDGGTILLNIYFNFAIGQNNFSWKYQVLLFFVFYLISYLMIFQPHFPLTGKFFLARYIFDLILESSHFLILFFLTIWLNQHHKVTNVLAMELLLYFVSMFLKAYEKHWEEVKNNIPKKPTASNSIEPKH
ncbi:MAG: hypothetical protein QM737_13050 [Ferruginibacter sp.]